MIDAKPHPVVIRTGRLLDVDTGEAAEGRVLHVGVDGRIDAIGAAGDGTPDDAMVFDALMGQRS